MMQCKTCWRVFVPTDSGDVCPVCLHIRACDERPFGPEAAEHNAAEGEGAEAEDRRYVEYCIEQSKEAEMDALAQYQAGLL